MANGPPSVIVWHDEPVSVDNDDGIERIAKLNWGVDVDAVAMLVPRKTVGLVVRRQPRTDVDRLDAVVVPLGYLDARVARTELDVNLVAPPGEVIVARPVTHPTLKLFINNVYGFSLNARCFFTIRSLWCMN